MILWFLYSSFISGKGANLQIDPNISGIWCKTYSWWKKYCGMFVSLVLNSFLMTALRFDLIKSVWKRRMVKTFCKKPDHTVESLSGVVLQNCKIDISLHWAWTTLFCQGTLIKTFLSFSFFLDNSSYRTYNIDLTLAVYEVIRAVFIKYMLEDGLHFCNSGMLVLYRFQDMNKETSLVPPSYLMSQLTWSATRYFKINSLE